jgi:hypothetical protein
LFGIPFVNVSPARARIVTPSTRFLAQGWQQKSLENRDSEKSLLGGIAVNASGT